MSRSAATAAMASMQQHGAVQSEHEQLAAVRAEDLATHGLDSMQSTSSESKARAKPKRQLA